MASSSSTTIDDAFVADMITLTGVAPSQLHRGDFLLCVNSLW